MHCTPDGEMDYLIINPVGLEHATCALSVEMMMIAVAILLEASSNVANRPMGRQVCFVVQGLITSCSLLQSCSKQLSNITYALPFFHYFL
jgi:3-dehydroquinate dehydratase